ncbi:MAG: response regulator [Flavobacteriales bacterium]|nr:response regulator [Flavobacteriales bacterium]
MNYLKVKILVVEDNLQDYIIFKEILGQIRDFFIHVEHAETLDQAIGLVRENEFDIVFLDLFLPDSFGQDTFTSLQNETLNSPIVILSGLSDKNIALEIVKLGAQDYIVKGEFDSNLLEKSIIYSIERKKFQDKLLRQEKKYKSTFQNVGVAIGEYDYTALKDYLEDLKKQGVEDVLEYLNLNLSNYLDIRAMLSLKDANPETLHLYGCESLNEFKANIHKLYTQKSIEHMEQLVLAIWNKSEYYEGEAYFNDLQGNEICTWKHARFMGNELGYFRMLMSTTNITPMKSKEQEVYHQAKLLQGISDGAVELIAERNIKDALFNVLTTSAMTLEADVGALLKLHHTDTENAEFKVELRWNHSSVNPPREESNNFLCGISNYVFQDHFDAITQGACVEMYPEELLHIPLSVPSDVCNLITVPILVDAEIWGMILMVRCTRLVKWSNYEKSSLQTVARNMGGAISREIVLDKLEELNDTLETRVVQRTEKMQSAIQELESFSYSISHDLRAPLRAINSFSQVLKEESENVLDEESKMYLTHIIKGAKEMSALIDDLLHFSRTSRLPMNFSVLDMETITREIIGELMVGVEDRDIHFMVHNLQPCQGDKSLVRQVMSNLIWNAIKYSRTKEQTRIEIGCSTDNDLVTYYVKDNGVGFDMAYSDKLFGVFQRLHTDADFEGTGVGLAIVKRIVNRHGGQVTAHGVPDEGATFTFSLPGIHAEILEEAHQNE